jgi:hypothetical protein
MQVYHNDNVIHFPPGSQDIILELRWRLVRQPYGIHRIMYVNAILRVTIEVLMPLSYATDGYGAQSQSQFSGEQIVHIFYRLSILLHDALKNLYVS